MWHKQQPGGQRLPTRARGVPPVDTKHLFRWHTMPEYHSTAAVRLGVKPQPAGPPHLRAPLWLSRCEPAGTLLPCLVQTKSERHPQGNHPLCPARTPPRVCVCRRRARQACSAQQRPRIKGAQLAPANAGLATSAQILPRLRSKRVRKASTVLRAAPWPWPALRAHTAACTT